MIETTVRLAGEKAFELTNAILVYSDGRRGFATLHDPVLSEDGGAPQLGAGRPVGTAFLKSLAKKLGQSISADILPANVLVRTSEVTAWWRPRSTATLFYRPSEAKNKSDLAALKHLSGKRVPLPALVFRATTKGLWVRALRANERPDATTALFTAPFFNVGKTGSVCVGSMRIPHGRGLDTLPAWERAFFESEFTHLLPGVIPTKHKGGFVGMWTSLIDVATFPSQCLSVAPGKQTLARFVQSDEGRDW